MNLKNRKSKFSIFLLIFVLLVFIIINYFFLYKDNIEKNTDKYKLHKDGVQVIKNVFDSNDVLKIKNFFENEQYNDGKKYLLNNSILNNLINNTLEL